MSKKAKIIDINEKTIKKCKICGKEDVAYFFKLSEWWRNGTHFRQKIFKDSRGRWWYGKRCHSCTMKKIREKRGTKPRVESSHPMIVAAVRRELLAAEKFKRLGFKVDIGHGAGPDLYCDIGSFSWTVEVKHAKHLFGIWYVERIRESRKSDDLVAIVLPDDRVYIDSMSVHLSKCTKKGGRTIRDLDAIFKE